MGWQDAPAVSGGWQSAPPVDQPKPTPYKPGDLESSIGEVSKDFGFGSKFMIGAAGAINSAAMRLKQLVGRDLTPEDIQGLKEYRALEKASGAAVAGDIGMNVLATLQPGMALQGAATNIASRVLPAAAAQTVGAATAGGAISAATVPVLEGESSLKNAAIGAAGGAAGDLAPRVLARVAQPIVQSEAVKKLTKEGIVPSIGQAAGGIVNRVEQQLESVPVVGWLIGNARGRAVKEFNEEAIAKALPNKADAATIQAGREGIERAGALVDNAYDSVYSSLRGKVKTDEAFTTKLSQIPNKEGIDLPPSLKERFDALIKDRVSSRLEDGAGGETLREINKSLGALARKYRSSADPDQRALGMAFAEAKSDFREMVSRQASEDFKPALDALDKKYTALLAVEKASGYSGSKEGIFSAEALKRASQKSSSEMRSFAETGADVLGRTVPDSGTAGRLLLPIAGGAAAGGNEAFGGPEFLTALALSPLAYSRIGSRYAIGDLPLQTAIANALRNSAPYTSQLGRSLAD